MYNPPAITPEQRAAALEKAAESRRIQCELKQEVREGRLSLADALDDPRAQRIRVFQLLKAVRGVGEGRARRAMMDIGIGDNRRVRGLGVNQRAALIHAFGESAGAGK